MVGEIPVKEHFRRKVLALLYSLRPEPVVHIDPRRGARCAVAPSLEKVTADGLRCHTA